MKLMTAALLLLISTSSFADTTAIDKCVDAALDGARASLSQNLNILPGKLFVEEAGLVIEQDAQYLRTRKEIDLLCRRLYIATMDLDQPAN